MNPRVLLAAVALTLAGCGESPGTDGGTDCDVAFNSAFADFRTWTSYVHDGPAPDDGGVHVAGHRTEYLNQKPPHGSTTFPVGTIVVKEVGDVDAGTHHLFSMVKRGCDFNANGAKDWEWIEITEAGGAAPHIIWRGVGPPSGEIYGGNPTSCNGCHQGCSANDSVCSSMIVLSNY